MARIEGESWPVWPLRPWLLKKISHHPEDGRFDQDCEKYTRLGRVLECVYRHVWAGIAASGTSVQPPPPARLQPHHPLSSPTPLRPNTGMPVFEQESTQDVDQGHRSKEPIKHRCKHCHHYLHDKDFKSCHPNVNEKMKANALGKTCIPCRVPHTQKGKCKGKEIPMPTKNKLRQARNQFGSLVNAAKSSSEGDHKHGCHHCIFDLPHDDNATEPDPADCVFEEHRDAQQSTTPSPPTSPQGPQSSASEVGAFVRLLALS